MVLSTPSSSAIDRRQGGGGRQERTNSPADQGGVHPQDRNEVEDPASAAGGLRPGAAGLPGSDAPRHLDAARPNAAAPRARRPLTGCTASRPVRPRRTGTRQAIVTAMPTRRRRCLGWSAEKVER
ncbi:hypothetical protein, partial [Novosphingobium sp. Rr 2-17]|uniref:hypothetical protein n=1 Tax=Novosphingobium sp. Rr 2-17 TaxID=555793 RepID=UPI001ED95DE0